MNWFGDSAHILHVAKTGNDANTGHAQQYPIAFAADAKLTIGSAISAAASGDIIIIWPGTYAEFVDLDNAAKQLHLIGTHRHLCKVIGLDADNEPVVHNYPGCTLENLTIENGESGEEAVYGATCDDTKYINCTIIDDVGIDALMADSSKRVTVKDCYLRSAYHCLRVGDEALVDNCILVVAMDGIGAGEGWCLGAVGADSIRVRNSHLIAQVYYGKTGKGAPLYESNHDHICISSANRVILENCVLIADTYRDTGANADSYCSGTPKCIHNVGRLVATNCIFKSWSDQDEAADAIGISNSNAQLLNCTFDVACPGSGDVKVFDADTAKTIYLANTEYDSTELGSNVTVKAVPAGIAFEKAAKSLINKAIQNKSTGAIDYYDDDEEMIILTLSPTDGESTITRTPS